MLYRIARVEEYISAIQKQVEISSGIYLSIPVVTCTDKPSRVLNTTDNDTILVGDSLVINNYCAYDKVYDSALQCISSLFGKIEIKEAKENSVGLPRSRNSIKLIMNYTEEEECVATNKYVQSAADGSVLCVAYRAQKVITFPGSINDKCTQEDIQGLFNAFYFLTTGVSIQRKEIVGKFVLNAKIIERASTEDIYRNAELCARHLSSAIYSFLYDISNNVFSIINDKREPYIRQENIDKEIETISKMKWVNSIVLERDKIIVTTIPLVSKSGIQIGAFKFIFFEDRLYIIKEDKTLPEGITYQYTRHANISSGKVDETHPLSKTVYMGKQTANIAELIGKYKYADAFQLAYRTIVAQAK